MLHKVRFAGGERGGCSGQNNEGSLVQLQNSKTDFELSISRAGPKLAALSPMGPPILQNKHIRPTARAFERLPANRQRHDLRLNIREIGAHGGEVERICPVESHHN